MRRSTRLLFALVFVFLATACVPEDSVEEKFGPDSGGTIYDGGSVDAAADVGVDGESSGDARGDVGGDAMGDAGADTADAAAPTPPLDIPITERGPYHVGYSEMTVTYQAEQDGTQEERELNVSMWYPTRDNGGWPARYADLFRRDEVNKDVEPAAIDDLPVLVFSHGNGGLAEQNYFLTEFLASRGWIAISPDHTGNTFKQGGSINLQAAIYRPQDIEAVLDRLDNLEEDHVLHGMLSDKTVMSGHSFGGYTTLATAGASFAVDDMLQRCQKGTIDQDYCDVFGKMGRPAFFKKGFYDERIEVAVPMAPPGGLIFQDGIEDLEVPTMLMTGEKDATLPNKKHGDQLWRDMTGKEHRRVNLTKGGHFAFSNMCDLFGSSQATREFGCGDEFIEPERAYEVINTYFLAYAAYHLYGGERYKKVIDGDTHPVGQQGFELSVP